MRGHSSQFKRAVTALTAISKAAIPARSVCIGLGMSWLALGGWSDPAAAHNEAIASVAPATGFQSSNLDAMGTIRLYAFSQQFPSFDPVTGAQLTPPIGPNATPSITARRGGVTGLTSPTGGTLTTTAGTTIIVSTGVVGQNQVGVLYGEKMKNPMDTDRTVPFTPTIGIGLTTTNPKTGKMTTAPAAVAKQSLTARGDNVTVTSTSGNYSGQAAAFISSGGVRGISADATTSAAPPPAGNAAARAYDPFEIPSGSSYVYDPTITASVELDSPDASGGIAAFAVDSSVFTTDSVDNFTADGTPLNDTLWYLSVGGDTPTTSTSDVLVDFELNPLALNEIMFPSSFLASIGPYSDTDSEALLIDQALDQSIASQLALNGDAVDLNGVDPFPTGTMFQAISGGVEYADDVDAVVSAAPEPASLVLLSGSLVILAGSRRVSKSARMTGEDSRL